MRREGECGGRVNVPVASRLPRLLRRRHGTKHQARATPHVLYHSSPGAAPIRRGRLGRRAGGHVCRLDVVPSRTPRHHAILASLDSAWHAGRDRWNHLGRPPSMPAQPFACGPRVLDMRGILASHSCRRIATPQPSDSSGNHMLAPDQASTRSHPTRCRAITHRSSLPPTDTSLARHSIIHHHVDQLDTATAFRRFWPC